MSPRKQLQTSLTPSNDLKRLLDEAREQEVSEEELRAQRVSFAFGNAPESVHITKASVGHAATHIRLR